MEQAARPEVCLPSPFFLLQETIICFKVRFASLIGNDCAKLSKLCMPQSHLKRKNSKRHLEMYELSGMPGTITCVFLVSPGRT